MANILVADDSALMRMIIRRALTKMGHTVIGEAINGEEAAKKYKELNPDLTILDITMSKVNGLDGIKRIKEIDSKAKIIMCSSMGQESMIADAIKFGTLDFIIKPFKFERIKKSVENALNKK